MKTPKTEIIIDKFHKMQKNASEGDLWMNVPLAEEILNLFDEATAKKEKDISEEDKEAFCKAVIEQDLLSTHDAPRFALRIISYVAEGEETIDSKRRELEDYINIDEITMEAYLEKHPRLLKFDPVERTKEWEAVIFDVEKECEELLKDEPRCMGFCFSYWSARTAALSARGIDWKSPLLMNPRVMFD